MKSQWEGKDVYAPPSGFMAGARGRQAVYSLHHPYWTRDIRSAVHFTDFFMESLNFAFARTDPNHLSETEADLEREILTAFQGEWLYHGSIVGFRAGKLLMPPATTGADPSNSQDRFEDRKRWVHLWGGLHACNRVCAKRVS